MPDVGVITSFFITNPRSENWEITLLSLVLFSLTSTFEFGNVWLNVLFPVLSYTCVCARVCNI